jgi:peptidoglycan hydrolase-like amidase
MNNKNKAWVKNGNKNYQHKVFGIRGGSIIKSWDTETYLRTPLSEIKRQLAVRNQVFRSKPW